MLTQKTKIFDKTKWFNICDFKADFDKCFYNKE